MAINKKLIHFKNFSDFNSKKLSANENNTQYTLGVDGEVQTGSPDILYQSICWIKDVKKIWTHGQYYDCNPGGAVSNSVYITPFTTDEIRRTYQGEMANIPWDYQAMMDAIRNNTMILVPYDEGFPGYSIVGACFCEDAVYFTIPTINEGAEYAIAAGIGSEYIYTSDIYYCDVRAKQDKLISGTNIKTINGNSILGSGDIEMPYYVDEDIYIKKGLNDNFLIYALPSSADGHEDDILATRDTLKTINGQSLIGSGDIEISSGGSSDANVQAVNTGDVIDDVTVEYTTKTYVDGLVGDINTVLESIING